MDEMTLIMALATIAFVGGLIRSFFTKRSDQTIENKQATQPTYWGRAEDTLEALRKEKLENLKLRIMAENPVGLMVPAKKIDPKERWKTPESDEDISFPVRPKESKYEYSDDLRELRKVYEHRNPKYHFLPHQGEMVLRILPAAPDGMNGLNPNPWFTTQQLHYIPDGLNTQTVPCNRVLGKDGKFVGNCPICSEYERILRDKSQRTTEQEKTCQIQMSCLKPTQRYYVNAIEWDKEKQSYGPVKVLSLSKPLFEKIREERAALLKSSIDPLDLNKGYDFHIVKKLVAGRFVDWSCGYYIPKQKPVDRILLRLATLFNLCRLHNYQTEDELQDVVYNWRKKNPSPRDKSTKTDRLSASQKARRKAFIRADEDFIKELTKI